MPEIRTIARPLRWEIPKVKGSRFIASVARAASPEEAAAFVEGVRAEYRDATHNCFGWRTGRTEDAFRYNDDGEPSGTAGRPILQEIDGRRLTDVVVVVTRYFGGTKLGTGGLIRAYGEAAAEGLDRAGVIERPVVETVTVRHGYDDTGAVQGVLSGRGLEPTGARYGAEVELELAVPVEEVEEVTRELRDATAGRAGIGGSG